MNPQTTRSDPVKFNENTEKFIPNCVIFGHSSDLVEPSPTSWLVNEINNSIAAKQHMRQELVFCIETLSLMPYNKDLAEVVTVLRNIRASML